MILFETIGLFIIALGCIVGLTLLFSFFISSEFSLEDEAVITSSICVIVFLLLIASITFVQFRHYPEKFGYTAIEEVEEVEESEGK